MPIKRGWTHPKIIPQKAAQIGGLPDAGHHLHAVTGGEHHSFIHAGLLYQAADGVRQLRLRDSKPLAHFQRRAVVVHADDTKVHGAITLCVWLKLLAAQASTAAPKANVA